MAGGGPDRSGGRRGHLARLACIPQEYKAPGKKTVPINHSIHMLGALEDGTLDLQFYDDLSASSYIGLVEHLVRRYGKVGILADNASAIA